MNSKNSLSKVPTNVPVQFCGNPIAASEFEKKKKLVQELVLKMIILGTKKGRPKKLEEKHEEAA